MARTLTEIDADIATLQACPPGVRSVAFADRTTTFNSPEDRQREMTNLLSERAAAAAVGCGGRRRRQVRLSSSKGL